MKVLLIILVAILVCECSVVQNLRTLLINKKEQKDTTKETNDKKNTQKDDKTNDKNKPKSLIALTLQDLDVFDNFKGKFKKDYKNDDKIESNRLLSLVGNKKKMENHNEKFSKGASKFKMGLWEHADMAAEEIVKSMTGFVAKARKKSFEEYDYPTDVPDHVNYTEQGWVSNVLNQGICGGCWAFSSLGALEGQVAKKTGKFVKFSEQNLIDCNKDQVDGNWGDMETVYNYLMKKNNGVNTASFYRYKGDGEFKCAFNPKKQIGHVLDYARVAPGDEELLKLALAHVGPLSIAVDASLESFQSYQGGVYDDPECSQDINHAVLLVGYGTDPDDGDYWLVKNSWGLSYGENGYIRIARNRDNLCGVASEIIYPIV